MSTTPEHCRGRIKPRRARARQCLMTKPECHNSRMRVWCFRLGGTGFASACTRPQHSHRLPEAGHTVAWGAGRACAAETPGTETRIAPVGRAESVPAHRRFAETETARSPIRVPSKLSQTLAKCHPLGIHCTERCRARINPRLARARQCLMSKPECPKVSNVHAKGRERVHLI